MILAFVYDFAHFKSAQGLFALKRAGFDDVVAVGAPWRKLPIRESAFQFKTLEMEDAHHPRDVAKALGYRYEVAAHEDVRDLLLQAKCGLVLGARVLPGALIEDAPPVVNIHPGVLPLNRGLDTLKWAVHDGLPQAATAHIIDARIDRGLLLEESVVKVLETDTPADVYNRLMWRQIAMVGRLDDLLKTRRYAPIGKGVYRRPMTLEQDVETLRRFMAYKVNYAAVLAGKARAEDYGLVWQ